MIVLSLFVEFDKIDATKSSFYRFLSKLTKTLLYGSTWQKVGAVFVTFCRFLSIFVTNFPSAWTWSDAVEGPLAFYPSSSPSLGARYLFRGPYDPDSVWNLSVWNLADNAVTFRGEACQIWTLATR